MATVLDNPSPLISRILGHPSRLAVVRCLYGEEEGMSGREIARRVHYSHQQVHNDLKVLVALGVVDKRVVAPAHVFRLNQEHWVVTDILRPVFRGESGWLDGLVSVLKMGVPRGIESLVLFGSASEGRLREHSDIDVLALLSGKDVEKSALGYFADRSADVLKRYQHPLAPLVMTVHEFRSRYRHKEEFVRSILKSGRVVHGRPLMEIL